ncbi:hypothetical protein AB5N19_07368 [Seiridium cardinale]
MLDGIKRVLGYFPATMAPVTAYTDTGTTTDTSTAAPATDGAADGQQRGRSRTRPDGPPFAPPTNPSAETNTDFPPSPPLSPLRIARDYIPSPDPFAGPDELKPKDTDRRRFHKFLARVRERSEERARRVTQKNTEPLPALDQWEAWKRENNWETVRDKDQPPRPASLTTTEEALHKKKTEAGTGLDAGPLVVDQRWRRDFKREHEFVKRSDPPAKLAPGWTRKSTGSAAPRDEFGAWGIAYSYLRRHLFVVKFGLPVIIWVIWGLEVLYENLKEDDSDD